MQSHFYHFLLLLGFIPFTSSFSAFSSSGSSLIVGHGAAGPNRFQRWMAAAGSESRSSTCPRIVASCRDPSVMSRRDVALAALALVPAVTPLNALAASDIEAGSGEVAAEGIRKLAAKLPGMGPPDVVYPEGMAGRWMVRKMLAGVDFPAGESAADPAAAKRELDRVGKATTFGMRFVLNEGSVVADREFNTRQEIAATEGKDVSVLWKMTNPNVLTVSYPSGEVVERKVTKRSASGGGEAPGTEFSEYSRVATLTSGGSLMGRGGGPEIGARWVRGKFKLNGPGQAEGILLEYVLPQQAPDPANAVMKLKYRLLLQKQEQ